MVLEVPDCRNVTSVTVTDEPPSTTVVSWTMLTVPLMVEEFKAPRTKNLLPQPQTEPRSTETSRTHRRRFTTPPPFAGVLLKKVYTRRDARSPNEFRLARFQQAQELLARQMVLPIKMPSTAAIAAFAFRTSGVVRGFSLCCGGLGNAAVPGWQGTAIPSRSFANRAPSSSLISVNASPIPRNG